MAQKKIPREKQGTHAKVMEAARLRAEADAFQELAAKREARAVKAELALPVWVDGKDGPRCEVSGVGRALLAAEKELARLRAEASRSGALAASQMTTPASWEESMDSIHSGGAAGSRARQEFPAFQEPMSAMAIHDEGERKRATCQPPASDACAKWAARRSDNESSSP